MSRTNHHKGQRRNKWGLDWGSRRPGNLHYSGGSGPIRKKITHGIERAMARQEVFSELKKEASD